MKSEYVDFAEYYDYDHNFVGDIGFFLDFARGCGSPILDLACGTGRVLIPLAEAGFEVDGLDISENMLALSRQKVEEKGLMKRVRLFQGNMARFKLNRMDFAFVFIALRSFMHLLTPFDQLACLERVHRHLQPGACFILTLIAPDPERLARPVVDSFTVRRDFYLPNGNRVIRKERLAEHDQENQIRRFEFKFEEYSQQGALVRERVVPLLIRYTFRYELQLMLERAGFELIELYRDYERRPYDGKGEMIVVARRADGR